jgi:hypothetical protein
LSFKTPLLTQTPFKKGGIKGKLHTTRKKWELKDGAFPSKSKIKDYDFLGKVEMNKLLVLTPRERCSLKLTIGNF